MTLIILNPDHFISGLPGLLACHAFFCLLSLPEINNSVNSQPGEIVDLQGMKRKKMKEEKNSCLRKKQKKQKKRDHPCVIPMCASKDGFTIAFGTFHMLYKFSGEANTDMEK